MKKIVILTVVCMMLFVCAVISAQRSNADSALPRRILCWGDSVTEGMAMPRGKDYPARLGALLGPGYEVLNSGDGGENSVTIPARQGAVPLATAATITFPAGELAVQIGDAADNGVLPYPTPLPQTTSYQHRRPWSPRDSRWL